MTVIRKDEQTRIKYADGVEYYVANDKSNGATMLSVGVAIVAPGAAMPSCSVDAELSWLFVDGVFEFVRGNELFTLNAGDCIHMPADTVHSFKNTSSTEGRAVLFCLSASPKRTETPAASNPQPAADSNIYRRDESYEFFPGVHRVDVTGEHTGANCYMADCVLDVECVGIPRHYHPAHEEAMLVLDGEISYIYGDDEVVCRTGDSFLAETKIFHGAKNKSGRKARMLAIHPLLNPPRIFDPPID